MSLNDHHEQNGSLPTTTTFLPILDDLLSPDFRPVTYPPVITPLQTPTTNLSVHADVKINGVVDRKTVKLVTLPQSQSSAVQKQHAAAKIQKWWKRNKNLDASDLTSLRAKHSIRHARAEEHIRHLECEITRLKSSLSAERKLRSLQFEAIKTLWSQIQKLSAENQGGSSIMTQSLPNGLPGAPVPNPVFSQLHCECASEIEDLKLKIETEVGELRALVTQLLDQSNGNKVTKRPDSLNLNGGKGPEVVHKEEELQGYADNMASLVIEDGKKQMNDNE
ncbi:Centrosomal protein of 97 kDa [Orchesella cincta]|uniref:Centrosomal protein of 97 kDa n=1 Tax=Orchesella cincta TaxID=48709 RepID=A0A1D2NFI6_ORCCI|nr:Centrosomal protein of 97 kDa [Orchesella cincta]